MEIYFKSALLVLVLIQMLIRGYYVQKYFLLRRQVLFNIHKRREILSSIGLGIVYFVPIFTWCFSDIYTFAQINFVTCLRFWGIGLGVFSIGCFYKAHQALGNHWSPFLEVKQQHKLVKKGVFKYVRHPMYSSLLIGVVGILFLTGNYAVFGIVGLGVSIFIIIRLKDEELLMQKIFGVEYKNYCKETKCLIPFIW